MIGEKKLYTRSTLQLISTASTGTLTPPADAVGMRVAVLGGGGNGAGSGTTGSAAIACGGSGAGCAATKITLAESISYTVGAAGANSTASFGDYSLVGGAGSNGNASTASQTIAGGTGSGGDYNFTGGSSFGTASNDYVVSTGGAGAGPNGNGGDGVQAASTGLAYTPYGADGQFTNTGWGFGGGAAGRLRTGNAQTLSTVNATGFGLEPMEDLSSSARAGSIIMDINPSLTVGVLGGGGRAGGDFGAGVTPTGYSGGAGAMLVEWFYFD